jgi:hypothetical protein
MAIDLFRTVLIGSLAVLVAAYAILSGGIVPHDAHARRAPPPKRTHESASEEQQTTSQAGITDPTAFDTGRFFAEWLSHGQTGVDVSAIGFGPTARAEMDAADEVRA